MTRDRQERRRPAGHDLRSVDSRVRSAGAAGVTDVERVLGRRAATVASEAFVDALDRLDGVDPATAAVLAAVASDVAHGVLPSVDESTGTGTAAVALALFDDGDRDGGSLDRPRRE